MRPVKVVICHLTATICSSPKDLMFKSLMKKKKLSLILMSNYFSKEMKIANPCHVQENVMLCYGESYQCECFHEVMN